jgi:HPt (histidine-containing phosphotransfer) domain-containing protein
MATQEELLEELNQQLDAGGIAPHYLLYAYQRNISRRPDLLDNEKESIARMVGLYFNQVESLVGRLQKSHQIAESQLHREGP